MGTGGLPDDYFECFLCDSLHVTLEELNRQDSDWVIKMIAFIAQRNKVNEHKEKSANSSSR